MIAFLKTIFEFSNWPVIELVVCPLNCIQVNAFQVFERFSEAWVQANVFASIF